MQLLGQTPIMQVVAVAVAGSLLPRVVQAVLAVVELAVVPQVTMDQAAPTDSAAAVVADLPAHLQLVAVARALSLCVTQTCPPFRANPQHERCRLVRRPHSQSLLQQRVQLFRISGRKMVLIFQAQQRRVTPLLLQWSAMRVHIA
jgi:hypothetical protein